MPYPQNYVTAKEVESIVRENGAIPATIAILDGTPCIGTASCFLVYFFQLFMFSDLQVVI